MGATHVVVESSDHREGTEGQEYYYGRGIGYICPEGAENEAPIPPPHETPAAAPDAGTPEEGEDEHPGRHRRRRAHGH
jgi:hypothetical protein